MKPDRSRGAQVATLRMRVAALVVLGSLSVTGGCKQVAAKGQSTKEASLPTAATHQVYAGRAMLLLPRGVDLTIKRAEVNEVQLQLVPGAASLEQQWAARLAAIRTGKAERMGGSQLDREWPGEHLVQYDTARRTLDVRTWEQWGVLGNSIVQANTVAPLAQADAARQALAEVLRALLPDGTPQPGDFRFQGGLVRVPLNGAEHISAEWKEPVFEHVGQVKAVLAFTFITEVLARIGKPDTLQRLAKARAGAAQDGFTFKELRSGKRTVNGLEGEESVYLLSDPKQPLRAGFAAEWITAGRAHDAYAPSVELSADIDDINPADGDAAMAQWTAALQSLRFPAR